MRLCKTLGLVWLVSACCYKEANVKAVSARDILPFWLVLRMLVFIVAAIAGG